MKRNIITIHEELCNGCAICVDACHEGAIEIIDGKAKLVSDIYCDGLGDCLPNCPTGAIEMIEREALDYDDDAVQARMAERGASPVHAAQGHIEHGHVHAGHSHAGHDHHGHGHGEHGHGHHAQGHGHGHGAGHGGCPGSMARRIERSAPAAVESRPASASGLAGMRLASASSAGAVSAILEAEARPSELTQWPIQLNLVNPANPYFDDANLLIAADCTAFAYADFHRDFIRDHITLIGCPKLDDNAYYAEKLTEILRLHSIRSITVVRMVVPCCGGIVQAVKHAMLAAQTIVPYREVTVGIDGKIC